VTFERRTPPSPALRPAPGALTGESPASVPIVACSLPVSDAHHQLGEWRALLATASVETTRVSPTELHFRLRDDLGGLRQIVTLAQREKACCPFLDFALMIEPGAVRLTISVPEGGVPVLDAFAAFGR
jgi:hypothetical protein